MIEKAFPELYLKADAYADRWQKHFLRSQYVQLGSYVIAAGTFGLGSGGRLVAVLAFVVAIIANVYRLTSTANRRWWNGRAVAESAKTLAWRYTVGGLPFGRDGDELVAIQTLAQRLTDVATKIAPIVPVSVSTGHITPQMKAERNKPLIDRIRLYQDERIRQQMSWYSDRTDKNNARSRTWAIGTISAQGLAVVLGVMGLMLDSSFDFAGFLAAVAASATAWVAAKQFDVLATSYAVASNELASIDVQISSRTFANEADWAEYVDSAEEAISREHTSWRASRAV